MYAVKPNDVYDRDKDIKDGVMSLIVLAAMSRVQNIGDYVGAFPEPCNLLSLPVKIMVCTVGVLYIAEKVRDISKRMRLRKLIGYACNRDEYDKYYGC